MGTRVIIKVLLALVVSAIVAVWGYRVFTGRNPGVGAGVGMTAVIFAAIVALDASIGW